MAKPEARIQALQGILLIGALAMAVRAGYLQLVQGRHYAQVVARQRTEHRVLEAPRGVIYDRNGTPLAASLERYHIDLAGKQIRNPDQFLALYRTDIGTRVEQVRRAIRDGDDLYLHGPFTAGQVRRIRELKGVYLRPLYRRDYPSGPLARPLIGALSPDSAHGASGLERFLDSLLQGQSGEAVYVKDAAGRTYESPGRMSRPAIRGADVTLTIDRDLQEIAEGGLTAVFKEFTPQRADIVFLNPRTGEILAAASREVDAAGRQLATASFFQSSFEPGSTAKPFTAAALLSLDRVKPDDRVAPEGGKWKLPLGNGRFRTITDDHPQKVPLSLARTIQVSSNVGIVKFGGRLAPAEHFDALRNFGFGTPTGVEFPVEAAGKLYRPDEWRPGQHGPSVAMGYGVEVTPIQLAAAYGAIANDGVLLAPSLIREIRSPEGKLLYQHRPQEIRRAVSARVAEEIRNFLALSAADSGTGGQAQVKGMVLGKTGTAKLVINRRYSNEHAASFAGIYPARDPQLVFVIRVEKPHGQYYGGSVAAPLVRRMLSQALSARKSAIDRTRLFDDVVVRVETRTANPGPPAPTTWVDLPLKPAALKVDDKPVPDVVGASVRAAAFSLHRAGFRVRVEGEGTVIRSTPIAGDTLAAGKTVTIVATRERP